MIVLTNAENRMIVSSSFI